MNEADIRNLGEQVGKYLYMGIAGGLTDNSKEAVQAFRGFYEKLKYQRDFDLISEAEYYSRLEALRDRYFSVGTDNWVRYTQKIYSYQKKTFEAEKKEIRSLYDDVADYATEKLDEVLKKQQRLASRLNDFGSLYKVNKVEIGGEVDYYYSLGDMDRDIEAIRSYGESFEKLSQRAEGLSVGKETAGLLEKIKEMDVNAAIGFMQALLNVEDTDFVKYAKGVQVKEQLSDNIAAKQYEKEFEDGCDGAYEYMKKKLSEAGYEIPEGFFVSGSLSAQRFGEAFTAELDLQLAAVRQRIDEFNANLMSDISVASTGNVYNTTNTSYNISSGQSGDAVDAIKRFEALKRLSGN